MSIIADVTKTFGIPGLVGVLVGIGVATFIAPNTWQGFVVLVVLTALVVILAVTIFTGLYRITRQFMSPRADVPSSLTNPNLPTTPGADSVDRTGTKDVSKTRSLPERGDDDQGH